MMFKQSAYLYKNIHNLYTDLVALNVGYRKMYARPLKLYKGIDNTFQLKLMNGDQKLINVVGQTLHWIMLDRNTAELKYHGTKTVEGSDNSLVVITVSEGDLEPINSGHYMYSTYLEDADGKQTILYGDSQYGATVPVEVVANAFPQVYPSTELSEFVNSDYMNPANPDHSKYTSAVNARPELNSKNNALHTVAIYSTGFKGTVYIEVTLDNGVTDVLRWSTYDEMSIAPEDAIRYINFTGVFTFVRFRYRPDTDNTGTLDKILYRS